MRVGLIAYGLDRPLSGIGRYSAELAQALVSLNSCVKLTLLTAGRPLGLGAANSQSQAPLAGCRLLPGLVTFGNLMVPIVSRNLGLEIVHDPTGITPFGFGASQARTVVTVHDVFAWAFPGTNSLLDRLIYHHWLPRILPWVDAVITDSQCSKDDIIRYLGVRADKVTVIPLGVNSEFSCIPEDGVQATLARYRISLPYILFLGAQDKRRNLPHLLQAYARLRRQGERRLLVIAGAHRGQSGSIAQEWHSLGIEDSVIFLGHVANADLPALYSGADLFVFPSLYEGFGLPPLEALACGTPVVCSNAASLPEVVGDAAVTFDPHNVEEMADAMRRVLANRDLREYLRQRGLQRAAQFTWERTARETVKVYEQVLGRA